jgi:hypothetical protein
MNHPSDNYTGALDKLNAVDAAIAELDADEANIDHLRSLLDEAFTSVDDALYAWRSSDMSDEEIWRRAHPIRAGIYAMADAVPVLVLTVVLAMVLIAPTMGRIALGVTCIASVLKVSVMVWRKIWRSS